MADFCKACSIEKFGEDFGDLRGISTIEDTAAKRFAVVICEGCAGKLVDHDGVCIGHSSCLNGHKYPL